MQRVVSFDIDGTLESGGPPGAVTRAHVLHQRELGHLIGSASDRTVTDQRRIWQALEIEPDFVVLKHRIAEVREMFPTVVEFWHVGDGRMDMYFAKEAGFTYFEPGEFSLSWAPGQGAEMPGLDD